MLSSPGFIKYTVKPIESVTCSLNLFQAFSVSGIPEPEKCKQYFIQRYSLPCVNVILLKKKHFSQTTRWLVFPFILRYLKEQIKQLKEEKNMAVSALARYKVRRITIHKHMLFNWGILSANYDLKWLVLIGHGGIWIILFNKLCDPSRGIVNTSFLWNRCCQVSIVEA